MKKIILSICLFLIANLSFSQISSAVGSITPSVFEENQSVTVKFTLTAPATGDLYLWAWAQDANGNNIGSPNNGAWSSSSVASKLTQTGSNTYIYTLTPSLYYNVTGIKKIGFLAKNLSGSAKSVDFFPINVGAFQVTLVAPTAANTNSIIDAGSGFTVIANNSGGNANYVLTANGTVINTANAVDTYSFPITNINQNTFYKLIISKGFETIEKVFSVIINAEPESENLPLGLEDGVNYQADATKVSLVLNAPFKDFVYVAGSFNNWNPTSNDLMKKDPLTGKFWIEISDLIPEQVYTFQYWVVDNTDRPLNSPTIVKTADPFSTLVLNNFDDPEIESLGVYPNLPKFPEGQYRDVTVIQTGNNTFRNYEWSAATTNFVKPDKDKLVIYEALVRDFDTNKTFQDLIDKIDYFKNLKINAIELMPVMEFEGNESWGYNTTFHLALDKRYGPPAKFKEFIDLCHQNGIAVILDVALNHVYGRSPIERMWMIDTDNDGWSNSISAENPYANQKAMHSYSVGTDLNHQSDLTQYYVRRTVKQWITEYKIDGFRWDLTKGFTQNCPYISTGNATNDDNNQQSCTNATQADRVKVLKDYVDYSWELDTNHYAIFEHLGGSSEEKQWADYRINEGKGIMMWSEQFEPYKKLIEGNTGGSTNISGMLNTSKGFLGRRVIGYPESHDKERLMYQARTYGASAEIKSLEGALKRMASIGAMSLPIPGPKMLWQFAELGWDSSIYTCGDGTVNDESNTKPGNCKLDSKEPYQWTQNWLEVPERKVLFDTYARIIDLKINEPVFNGTVSLSSGSFAPSMRISDNALPSTSLKNVVILSNFSTTAQNIIGNFPYTGTWYNLMDNTTLEVNATTDLVTIESGGFRMFGNKPSTLSAATFENLNQLVLHPNPSSSYFVLNIDTKKVQIFSITGQLVKDFNTKSSNYQYQISDLKNGIYFVKVSDQNNREKTIKLMKQ